MEPDLEEREEAQHEAKLPDGAPGPAASEYVAAPEQLTRSGIAQLPVGCLGFRMIPSYPMPAMLTSSCSTAAVMSIIVCVSQCPSALPQSLLPSLS